MGRSDVLMELYLSPQMEEDGVIGVLGQMRVHLQDGLNGLMRKNEGLNPDNTGLNAVRMYCAMQKSEKKCETRVPIYRYWSSSIGDHFYTRDLSELGEGNGVYSYEGIGFYLVEAGCENAVPLYRYWKSSVSDHFYTTS